MTGVCTAWCEGCLYQKKFTSDMKYCDYICMTGRRRPCPGGDGCTERIISDPFRPKAFTVVNRRRPKTAASEAERKELRREQARKRYAARIEEDKQKRREKCRKYYHNHKEQCNAKHREYYLKNREKLNAQNAQRRKNKREAEKCGQDS